MEGGLGGVTVCRGAGGGGGGGGLCMGYVGRGGMYGRGVMYRGTPFCCQVYCRVNEMQITNQGR